MKSYLAFKTSVVVVVSGVLCLGLMLTRPAICDTLIRHTPPFLEAGMVPLRNDRLLLWTRDGQIQIREQNGEWTPALRIPIDTDVRKVKSDGSGFLALGAPKTAFGKCPIVALNAFGQEIDRWSIDYVWDVWVGPSGRQAMTKTGLIPLLPHGAVGAEEPFPAGDANPAMPSRFPPGNRAVPSQFPPAGIFRWQGITVFCHPRDFSMQDYSPAICERPAADGWYYDGGMDTQSELAVACGPWLITNKARVKKKTEELVVLEMATGKVVGRRTYRGYPVFACAGDEELVVGGNRLELLTLPLLKPHWKSPVVAKHLAELVVMEHYFAFKDRDSKDILLLPRPALP